jgi:hypothetical protein
MLCFMFLNEEDNVGMSLTFSISNRLSRRCWTIPLKWTVSIKISYLDNEITDGKIDKHIEVTLTSWFVSLGRNDVAVNFDFQSSFIGNLMKRTVALNGVLGVNYIV